MSLRKRPLLLTSALYAFDVFQLKDAMLRRLFSFRRSKEEEESSPAHEPEHPRQDEGEIICPDPTPEEVPEVPKQQSDVDEEKPKNDVEPQTKIDLVTRKDGAQENKVPSAAPAEKDNEQPDIREENRKTESTTEVQKPGDLQSADFAKVEKEACLPEVTIHTKGGTNFDREDSGIEGDQGSASSSESDSPKQRNSLSEIRKTLDRRDKEKELLQNGLAHLSPIDLRRILERRQRINKESFPESPSPTPLASPLRRFYYRSPQKKRQELAKRPPWQSAYSSRPSLRWDPFSGGPERGRPFTNRVPHGGLYRGPLGWSSPIKKGILRPSQAARKVVSKSRQSGAEKGRNRKRANSETSDSNTSSGDESKHMPVRKIFSNQSALRKRIDDLEDLLRGMHEQREQVETVLRVLEDWARELRNVDRTKLGVPYIRDVKQVLGKHRQVLNNKESNLHKTLSTLEEVPYCSELHLLVEQLRNEVTVVVRDQRKFSAKTVENVRHIQGKLIGTCNAILAVYYDE